MNVYFKNKFFKDFENLPSEISIKVKELVLVQLPSIETLENIQSLKKIKGYDNYYRIRIGNYRIGLEIRKEKIVIYRVLHRKEIYRYFP